jgi:hypothetical protein
MGVSQVASDVAAMRYTKEWETTIPAIGKMD